MTITFLHQKPTLDVQNNINIPRIGETVHISAIRYKVSDIVWSYSYPLKPDVKIYLLTFE